MSRHRDVRNMDFSEDYDGYEDVYGHSVDDDYYISPSNQQFLYNRDNQPKIGEFASSEQDIKEEDESDMAMELSDNDKELLESCIRQVKETLGKTSLSKTELKNLVMSHSFNVERVMNAILNEQEQPFFSSPESVEKDVSQPAAMLPATAEGSTQQEVSGVQQPSIKVVAAEQTVTNVTKGFDLGPKEASRLNTWTPRSQSPASGRGTPTFSGSSSSNQQSDISAVIPKSRENRLDAEAQYKKERGDLKEHLYMVVIGHVDAGKSTMMGHLLCELGQINQRTMHKYEQESRKLGKQSFMYAWVLDETGEERNRGITMDVGRFQFETKTKQVTLLDAPGHKDFIPNMISGAGQADVALMVVDATRGEFETGFDYGGQTREHALLVRSLGVSQLAVAINKLDTVGWAKERFDEISVKLKTFLLKHAGFRESDVTFVPCSGLTGQNLVKKPTENGLLTWYSGPCLLEVIDNFRTPERSVAKPFRLSINDIFKGTGSSFCVSGRVETGTLNVGDRVLLCPNRELTVVKSLALEEMPQNVVFAGDQATVTLAGIEMQNVSVGSVLCDIQNPVQVASKFEARIVVFNVTVPITRGFSVLLHHQSLVEQVTISKLIQQLHRSTGELVKKHPRFLGNNTSAIVEITVSRPIALEQFSDCKELGRIMLRVGGVTIAAGLITKIIL